MIVFCRVNTICALLIVNFFVLKYIFNWVLEIAFVTKYGCSRHSLERYCTQIKWLYCEYRFYLTCTILLNCFKKYIFYYMYLKKIIYIWKCIYIWICIYEKSCVLQIHVCGVTTKDVTPLRKGEMLFGLLPVCKGHCRCWLVWGVHGEYILSYSFS